MLKQIERILDQYRISIEDGDNTTLRVHDTSDVAIRPCGGTIIADAATRRDWDNALLNPTPEHPVEAFNTRRTALLLMADIIVQLVRDPKIHSEPAKGPLGRFGKFDAIFRTESGVTLIVEDIGNDNDPPKSMNIIQNKPNKFVNMQVLWRNLGPGGNCVENFYLVTARPDQYTFPAQIGRLNTSAHEEPVASALANAIKDICRSLL